MRIGMLCGNNRTKTRLFPGSNGGRIRMKRLVVTAGLLCIVLAGTNLFAQSRITGTAADGSGALIPGVSVTATNTQTGVVTTVLSNESGAYNFASLQPGMY